MPKVVSVDDGYASAHNVAALEARKIEIVSINGAKGRVLTDRADWESEPFAEARSKRSAVESLMFTLSNTAFISERSLAVAFLLSMQSFSKRRLPTIFASQHACATPLPRQAKPTPRRLIFGAELPQKKDDPGRQRVTLENWDSPFAFRSSLTTTSPRPLH